MPSLKVCAVYECHNVFETSGARKYCSSKCRQQAYRKRHHTVPFKADYIRKNCRNCGHFFNTNNDRQEYCSKSCKQQHYRERIRLEKEMIS